MQLLPPQTVTTYREPPMVMGGWTSFFAASDGLLFFNLGGLVGTIGLFDPATNGVVSYGNEPLDYTGHPIFGGGPLQSAVPASCGMVVVAPSDGEAWWLPLQSWNQYELVVPIMIPGAKGTLLLVSDGTFLYVADTSNSNIYRTRLL
jgi:hypothetical protein